MGVQRGKAPLAGSRDSVPGGVCDAKLVPLGRAKPRESIYWFAF